MPRQSYKFLDAMVALSRPEREQLLNPAASATPAAAVRPAPIIPRAVAAAVPAKPVVPPPSKLTTAAEFASKKLTMTREEFSKLDPGDKSRFIKEGGRLVEAPTPAKMTHKNGQLTRHGFSNLSAEAKAAHCKAGNVIID